MVLLKSFFTYLLLFLCNIRVKINKTIADNLLDKHFPPQGESKGAFAVLTLHRPANVDEKQVLAPRTQARLKQFELWEQTLHSEKLILVHPIGYHEMLRLNMDAKIMLPDSGGMETRPGGLCRHCWWPRESHE